MKVFIAEYLDYDDSEILGVFETQEKAESAIKEHLSAHKRHKEDCTFLYEYEVQ
ncbi:hypothetical protein [Enterobacter sp. R1(2018)]|uniref:DUF7336 domain-containing protein n=1 Tax=Enterobacter sp. R1(2018) TaxID=2447891 RepID=UPI001602A72B|nr:hypothetical protein [Enterobacter sp. R1(2018)]